MFSARKGEKKEKIQKVRYGPKEINKRKYILIVIVVFLFIALIDSSWINPTSKEAAQALKDIPLLVGEIKRKQRIQNGNISKWESELRASAEWLDGGTLHGGTVQEWRQATYKNRLARSANGFHAITKAHNTELKKKLDALSTPQWLIALKAFAIQYEKCISDMVNGERIAKGSDNVGEYASMCYTTMYGTD